MTTSSIDLMKQSELDAFEKAVLIGLFDEPKIPAWLDLGLSLKGIDPQKYVNKFEEVMKPFMKDNGLVNSEAIKKLVSLKNPKYAALFPNHDFRLVEIVENVTAALADLNIINFVKA